MNSAERDTDLDSRRHRVWRDPDFMKLWTAAAISQIGSQVTFLALPLIAISLLGATPLEVGALQAVGWLPYILVGLPVGVWVDRLRRRPVLVAADLGRAAVLLSIPVAHVLDVLTIWQLYAVIFVAGMLDVFFDVADQSYLPSLVEREHLVEGNSALELAQSGARVAGPGLAGVLIGWLTAPLAVIVDVLSYIGSAGLLVWIRKPEPPPAPPAGGEGAQRTHMLAEIGEGISYLAHHRFLRPLASFRLVANLGWAVVEGIFLLYAIRELGLEPAAIGVIFTTSSLGLLVAAAMARRLVGRLGFGVTIVAASGLQGFGVLLVPLAPQTTPLPFLVLGLLIRSFGNVLFNINEVSLRQAVTPERMRGRANATMRLVSLGILPVGYLVGGALATVVGLRPVIWLGAILVLLAVIPVVLSPVRGLCGIPQPSA